MSPQADFIVSNGTGAAVRSDLNVQFAAIVSNNSGATEPATMYAYQWWADTTTGLLKLRNAANSGWVTIRQLDGEFSTVPVENGTAAAPSIFFKDSGTDTGLFSPGADQVAISTGGTVRLTSSTTAISSALPIDVPLASAATPSLTFTGDLDTGIFSPGADTLAITTAGTNRLHITSAGLVGIGTTPTNTDKLEIQTSSTSAPGLWVQTGGTTSAYPIADFRTGSNLSALVIRGDGASVFTGKVLVGTPTARANFFNSTVSAALQVEGTGNDTSSFSITRNSADVGRAILTLAKTRGGSVGSTTVVQSDDALGSIEFQGSDGTEFVQAAAIQAEVDGTPGANDMPGRLTFSVTRDGSASPTETLRIRNTGETQLFSTAGGFVTATSATAGTATPVLVGRYSATTTTDGTNALIAWSNGNLVNANNSYGSLSDIKLKENIVDAGSQWDDLKSLQVRNYNFKEGQTHTQIGLIAQEVELVSPGLVSESPDRDEDGNDLGTVTKSVNYSVLYMKAVKALQEAMERIEQLEQRLTDAGIA
jgi:hypothetical protein